MAYEAAAEAITLLKNNNEILEEKNKEISEEKETINDLGVKINALKKIL